VFVPKGQSKIKLYGYDLALLGNLEPTGTNLDRTLFMTFPTAYRMAQVSQTQAAVPLPILQDKVSSIMVKIAPDADPDVVARDIQSSLQNVTATVSPEMFGTYRSQVSGLMRTMLIVLALTVALAAGITALVFWMAVHDRRRQIGVLRALGATQRYVMASYMTEAVLLALAGGVVGVVLAGVGLFLFRDALVSVLGFPFLFPSIGWLTGLVVAGLVVALVVVAAAAALPAWRAAREEPADAMRE
jgi:putative ABC transport system permease protein